MIDREGVEAHLFDVWLLVEAQSIADESGVMSVLGGGASARFSLHTRARVAMEMALGGPEQPAQISGVSGAVRERHN